MINASCPSGPPGGYIQINPLAMEGRPDNAVWTSHHGPERTVPAPRYREGLPPRAEDHATAVAHYAADRTEARDREGPTWA
eukprot:2647974-Alexandrium_andersonii.AAC.1